jgi:hypothetical protein
VKVRCSKPRSPLFFVIIKPNYSNLKSMQGIQYIIDDQGEKKAVVIDLEQWGQEWNAFYHLLLAHSDSNENWLQQPLFLEKLDQSLEWNRNHPPQTSDLDLLETQLQNNE